MEWKRRDERVVLMEKLESAVLRQHLVRGENVVVHPLDPRHEAVEVAWPARLADAMNPHASRFAEARILGLRRSPHAAREHVHPKALAHERLGQLAHVPREAALDNRRILP